MVVRCKSRLVRPARIAYPLRDGIMACGGGIWGPQKRGLTDRPMGERDSSGGVKPPAEFLGFDPNMAEALTAHVSG